LAVAVHAQAPPQLPTGVVPFVSVNAPRVALTHVTLVDGTGAPASCAKTGGDVVRTPAAIYDVVTVFKDGVGFDPARLRAAARGRVGLN
jgi:hypothetical protein